MTKEKKPLEKPSRSYCPSGAIFVTTLVTVVTLVLWLGTYILNLRQG